VNNPIWLGSNYIIIDMLGNKIIEGKFTNEFVNQLPTAQLASGIYLLRVVQNNEIITLKFLK
jgi:hypothetical protein